MPEISIRNDVYFCLANGRYVFLDFAVDAYYALDAEKSARFADLLSAPPGGPRAFEATLGDLAGARLFARPGETGKALRPTAHLSPSVGLSGARNAFVNRADAVHVLRTCLWTALERALRPLGVSVAAARRRKTLRAASIDRAQLSRLLSVFESVRDFVPRRRSCLFDSLALLHFLRDRGVAADWTFGVRLDPFAAHCWLEVDNIALGEDPERLALFTPIAVI